MVYVTEKIFTGQKIVFIYLSWIKDFYIKNIIDDKENVFDYQ